MDLRFRGVSPRRAAARALFFVCALFVFTGTSHAQQRQLRPQRQPVETLPPPASMREAVPEPEPAYAPPGYPDESYSWDEGVPCDGCDTCGGGGCGSCGTCCNGYGGGRSRCISGWIGGEYLRWQIDGGETLPPLVTDGDTAILGDPGTQVLFGNDNVGEKWRDGFRVFAGVWLDCCHTWAIEADYFRLDDNSIDFQAGNEEGTIVGRPFFNTQTNEQDVELVSQDDQLAGTVDVDYSDVFEGAGLSSNCCLWRCCDPCSCCSKSVNFITGYRYYRYDSALTITENLLVLPDTQTQLIPGTTFLVQDKFIVRNDFNGAEIGLAGAYQCGSCWIDGMAKLALGTQRTTVIINGQTVTTVPNNGGAPITDTAAGGLLTSSVTNIGRYTDHQFTAIPEFRIGLGAMLTKGISARIGYNVIIWNDVMRVSDALPPGLAVDPRNLPPVQAGGGQDPRFAGICGSNFIAHGITAGVEWAF